MMKADLIKGSSAPSDDGDIEFKLLRDTQAYLDSRCRGEIPQPLLNDAWERFYKRYMPMIRSYVFASRLPESDQGDCIQEVWKEVVGRLGRFRYDPGRGRFRTWLYTLARTKVADMARHHLRHPARRLGEAPESALCGHDPDPAAEYERHRMQARVRDALDELSREVTATSYQVLYLRWIEGRSVREIATTLGLTTEQVRFRHHRVKRKLRTLIGLAKEDVLAGGV